MWTSFSKPSWPENIPVHLASEDAMNWIPATVWALLVAAPVFCQPAKWMEPQTVQGELKWFQLGETESEVRARLGQPAMIADFGGYRSWQYRLDEATDHDDFSHALVFRKSDGKLVSISRTYAEERNLDAFFPDGSGKVHYYPDAAKPAMTIRLRRLPGGRVLLATGVALSGQITLMADSELRIFYPWIEK